jgi:uncharacterized membrane-anchored protein
MWKKLSVGLLFVTLSVSLPALAQSNYESEVRALKWTNGPTTVTAVGDASIFIPQNYGFLDGIETRKFDFINQNPSDDNETNTFAPNDLRWSAYLSFDAVGYVKDDEQIDAAVILQSFKDGTEAANLERKKNGWEALHVTGWKHPPHYDSKTNRLVWAMEAQTDSGNKVINYNERLLGRKGVTSATLVTDPETLDSAINEFEAVIAGYQFSTGNTYAEFRPGDHVAEIGLAALILGGGAAAVAKSGAGFFKVIFFAMVAGFAGIVGIFKWLFGRTPTK